MTEALSLIRRWLCEHYDVKDAANRSLSIYAFYHRGSEYFLFCDGDVYSLFQNHKQLGIYALHDLNINSPNFFDQLADALDGTVERERQSFPWSTFQKPSQNG